jgi:hypothetical protein
MSTGPRPNWLPPLAVVNPWTEQTYNQLYAIFERDIKKSRLLYDGRNVGIFTEMEDGREVVFWHLTSKEDRYTGERLPDLRRSERLPWIRPVILNCLAPGVRTWDFQEQTAIKTYVWLEDEDYVVIMKRLRNGERRLITAFCIEYDHSRRTIEKKYNERIG